MLSIGIVGLPNVGKSTLFNILTGGDNALAANYPFATIEPNTGIANVPDERLAKLAEIYQPKRAIPAVVKFVDIAGLVAGASQGEGLGNKFLANIRECDAIVHVVRAFENNNIVHVNNQINPQADIEIINTELLLADLQSVDNRLAKITKELKADPKKANLKIELEKVKSGLEAGFAARHIQVDLRQFEDLNLLSAKPVIYLFNINESDLNNQNKLEQLRNLVQPDEAVFVAMNLEDELKDLSPKEAKEFLESYGTTQSGLEKLIKSAYHTLGLQSFLTAGNDEVRAWTIRQGTSAPQAAGTIHSDFERGFIAAEIINYHDLINLGSEIKVREAGKIRTEGKDYIMQPNDIVNFRFNV